MGTGAYHLLGLSEALNMYRRSRKGWRHCVVLWGGPLFNSPISGGKIGETCVGNEWQPPPSTFRSGDFPADARWRRGITLYATCADRRNQVIEQELTTTPREAYIPITRPTQLITGTLTIWASGALPLKDWSALT